MINGVPGALIPPDDRGLVYGDGLFETVAIVDGRLCLWRRHIARLRRGCERLRIPMHDLDSLEHNAEAMTAAIDHGVLKIVVTRGVGGRGYRIPSNAHPSWMLSVFPWPETDLQTAQHGPRVRLCATPVSSNPALAGLKHLGRLDNVLARSEWSDNTIAEGLMRDMHGNVVEGTQSNLFLEVDRELITPTLADAGVAGVVRGLIMDLATDAGSPVLERKVSFEDVQTADALFLTNSIMGISSVRYLEQHRFPDGQPVHPVISLARERVYQA